MVVKLNLTGLPAFYMTNLGSLNETVQTLMVLKIILLVIMDTALYLVLSVWI